MLLHFITGPMYVFLQYSDILFTSVSLCPFPCHDFRTSKNNHVYNVFTGDALQNALYIITYACVLFLTTGPVRVTRLQLALYCFLLFLILCKCTEESVLCLLSFLLHKVQIEMACDTKPSHHFTDFKLFVSSSSHRLPSRA